jgi:hypothetical protein
MDLLSLELKKLREHLGTEEERGNRMRTEINNVQNKCKTMILITGINNKSYVIVHAIEYNNRLITTLICRNLEVHLIFMPTVLEHKIS